MAQPRKKAHELIAERLEAQKTGAPTSEESGDDRDLADPDVQNRIMHPDGTKVALSDASLTVYPYTLEFEGRAYGFCSAVMADAYGAGARSMMELGLRIAALILRRADYKAELLMLVAIASGRPGVMDEKKAEPIAKELLASCKPKDYVELFHAVFDLSGMKDTPKPLGE